MINGYWPNRYCKDICNIENYEQAINDSKNKWELHHRLEIQNGKLVYTKKDLIDLNLYWNRPASELIFLTRKEHKALHQSIHNNFNSRGKSPWNKGKHLSDEDKKKKSEAMKGDKNPNYGKHFSEETRQKMRESHLKRRNLQTEPLF